MCVSSSLFLQCKYNTFFSIKQTQSLTHSIIQDFKKMTPDDPPNFLPPYMYHDYSDLPRLIDILDENFLNQYMIDSNNLQWT